LIRQWFISIFECHRWNIYITKILLLSALLKLKFKPTCDRQSGLTRPCVMAVIVIATYIHTDANGFVIWASKVC